MSDSRAIAGTYADLKFIKTRSVAQVVCEIPIEEADAFLKMFGAPQPGKEIPIAIARLNAAPSSNGKTSDFESEDRGSTPRGAAKERRAFSSLSLPEQAGIRCEDTTFKQFIEERSEHDDVLAAPYVRGFCGVASRAELATNKEAATKWRKLNADFEAWQTTQKYADARR